MQDIMTDNQFPECNATQEGRPCLCATCNRARLDNMMAFNSPSQSSSSMQQLVDTGSPMDPMAYVRDVPQHMLFGVGSEEAGRHVAPYAPMGDTEMDHGTKPEPEEVNSMFDQHHMNNYFEAPPQLAPGTLLFPNIAPRPSTESEQDAAASTPTADQEGERTTLGGEPGEPSGQGNRGAAAAAAPARRKGRGSKYGPHNEVPRSPYGPPFHTQAITTDMSEDEIHRRIERNAAVAEARRTYLRAKNNAAAKRSRERKQRLIDTLTADVDRLELRNEQMAAANRELVAAVGTRSHALEAENARLRAENDALRAHAADLAARLEHVARTGTTTTTTTTTPPPPRPDNNNGAAAAAATAEYPTHPLMQQQQQQDHRRMQRSSEEGPAGAEVMSPPREFDLEALFGMPQSQSQSQHQHQHQAPNGGLDWDGYGQN
ncbi:hypothetical protein F4809DRAFT_664220 [Biscogniauxia mediterranea]|nr:hypothetical protein F4809DRAFT_664220 [Biscogniauxia mediterranea]